MSFIPLSTAKADAMILEGISLLGQALYGANKDRLDNNNKMNLDRGLFSSNAKCLNPVGSIRIHEPESDHWSEFKLSSPTNILQAIIIESNCFTVVNRGAGFAALQHERSLIGGESALANAQIRSADYILVPDLISQNANAGGSSSGAQASQNSGITKITGGFGLSTKTKTSEVVLSLVDVRTTEQIISVSGEAKISDKDWNLLVKASDGLNSGSANLGNWSNTEIGKVIKTAYQNTYKTMILDIGKKDLLSRYGDQKTYSNLSADATPIAKQSVMTTVNNINVVNVAHNSNHSSLADTIDTLAAAKTLILRRSTRLFTSPDLSSDVVGEIREGMLVYPVGSISQNMIKIEDEQGRTGWVSTALLNIQQ